MPTTNSTDLKALIGLHVMVTISEPWEFQAEAGAGRFMAEVRAAHVEVDVWNSGERISQAFLLRALKPFAFSGLKCEHFVASPRHRGRYLTELLHAEAVPIGLVRASDDRSASDEPFNEHRWRTEKTIGLIGDLSTLAPSDA